MSRDDGDVWGCRVAVTGKVSRGVRVKDTEGAILNVRRDRFSSGIAN